MENNSMNTLMVISEHGTGKSFLADVLRMEGRNFIAGPVHTDSEEDIRRSNAQDDGLFSERGLAHFHDAVLCGCEKSLSDEQLHALFDRLPQSLQDDIKRFGLSDTPVRDAICVWARQNASTT